MTKTNVDQFDRTASSKKGYKYIYILIPVLIPFIIYFYFLRWKLSSFHDDDMYILLAYLKEPSTINTSIEFGQFRPVRDFFLNIIIKLFNNNFSAYYLFNVFIQSINTILFAYVLKTVVRSTGLAFFLSLTFGLSRFCLYNVIQLFNGGILEGLAIMFFLFFLFFLARLFTESQMPVAEQKKCLLVSILFANLALYTHERYIILFPFIILTTILFPGFKKLSLKWKLILSGTALASIFLNIIIKSFFYSMLFLRGSANTNISFSFSTGLRFLRESVYNILQYSTGPEHLVGLQFTSIPFFYRALVFFIIALFILIIVLYLKQTISALIKTGNYLPDTAFFFFLFLLFLCCLLPVVFQIRLELRWFQASFCTLIVMFVIGINSGAFQKSSVRHLLYLFLGISFLCTNFYYVHKGSDNLYYCYASDIANAFETAVEDGTISLDKKNIFIVQKKKNASVETDINWTLGNGQFFIPYQGVEKKLFFTDPYTPLANFNRITDEILYLEVQPQKPGIKYSLTNITTQYIEDSLKSFNEKTLGIKAALDNSFHRGLKITAEMLKNFKTDGFYDEENNISWTSGNAFIDFKKANYARDSVVIRLSTFMPPKCAGVAPRIFLTGQNPKEFRPLFSKREADIFVFTFYFNEPAIIEKINIRAQTIDSGPEDKRVLSFPFISLEIN